MIFPEAMTDLAMYRRFRAAVKVPILANITEFGQTPLFTTRASCARAGVDIVLYCCSAYRAMNEAALNVYETIRARRHAEEPASPLMQTRAELYDFLGYHAYEAKLDELFGTGQGGRRAGHRRQTSEHHERTDVADAPEAQEIRRAVRRRRRQHRAVHGRPHRQRPALPRLRHPRHRRRCEFEEIAYLLVHGKLPNVGRARRLQGEAASRCAACRRRSRPRSKLLPAAAHPMDVHAHRLFGARLRAAGEG